MYDIMFKKNYRPTVPVCEIFGHKYTFYTYKIELSKVHVNQEKSQKTIRFTTD